MRWVFVGDYSANGLIRHAVRIPEERVPIWVSWGWTVIIRERDLTFADLDDVRREDERGRRG